MITALAALLLHLQGLELTGKVTGAEGRPLAGASVFVATARPRRGPGTL